MSADFFRYARPIWQKGQGETKNLTCLFVAEVPVAGEATVSVAACNFYRLKINGKFVAYGPARAPKGYARVDVIRVGLERRTNEVAIEVEGNNCKCFYGLDERPFLCAEITVAGSTYFTGRDFRCYASGQRIKESPRYSYQRPFTECYDYTSLNIPAETEEVARPVYLERVADYPRYDVCRAELVETGEFAYDESLPLYENRCLTQESIGLYKKEELKINPNDFLCRLRYKPKVLSALFGGQYATFDLGQVKSGFIGLSADLSEESEICVIFDEIDFRKQKRTGEAIDVSYNRNDSLNFIYIKAPEGQLRFGSFEPYSARYIKVVVKKGAATGLNVELTEYENPDTGEFSFSSEDEELDAIVTAAKNTFKHNAVDIPTDCPGRERAGWLCDSWFISEAEKLFTGKNLTERVFLENFALKPQPGNLPDGMIGMCYPAEFEDGNFIPNWAMWYVLEVASAAERGADRRLIEDSKKVVYGVIAYFNKFLNEYGLLEDLEKWVFIEWSRANDKEFTDGVNFPSNMLYSLALKRAGEIYGDAELVRRSERVAQSIRDLSFDGRFFVDNAVRKGSSLVRTGNVSETCQYYAFFTGVADKSRYKSLFDVLYTYFGADRDENSSYPKVAKSAAFIGNYLRLIVLSDEGCYEKVLSDCKKYFLSMAKLTSTLWEHAGSHASLDHGFASFAGKAIVGCVSGLVGVNEEKGELYVDETGCLLDFDAVVPLARGKVRLSRRGGKTIVSAEGGYRVVRESARKR